MIFNDTLSLQRQSPAPNDSEGSDRALAPKGTILRLFRNLES
jgi:hypothetical protein